MNFIEFQDRFSGLPVISIREIEMAFPGFDRNALTRWQKKGYLKKIRSGYYRLVNRPVKGDLDLFFIANRIYAPSYVSLHSAFRWYDFIPEGVFTITSVTSRKTEYQSTYLGDFHYHHLKPNLFFGYRLEGYQDFQVKIADPAKAVLDFLYLHSHLDSPAHFAGLRFNIREIQEKVDFASLKVYLQLFDSQALKNRVEKFIQFINYHATTF